MICRWMLLLMRLLLKKQLIRRKRKKVMARWAVTTANRATLATLDASLRRKKHCVHAGVASAAATAVIDCATRDNQCCCCGCWPNMQSPQDAAVTETIFLSMCLIGFRLLFAHLQPQQQQQQRRFTVCVLRITSWPVYHHEGEEKKRVTQSEEQKVECFSISLLFSFFFSFSSSSLTSGAGDLFLALFFFSLFFSCTLPQALIVCLSASCTSIFCFSHNNSSVNNGSFLSAFSITELALIGQVSDCVYLKSRGQCGIASAIDSNCRSFWFHFHLLRSFVSCCRWPMNCGKKHFFDKRRQV